MPATITHQDSSVNAEIARQARSKLPPRAQEKVRKIYAVQRRSSAEKQALSDHQQELVRNRGEVDREIASTAYTVENGDFQGPVKPWHDRLAELRQERDGLTLEIEAAREDIGKVSSVFPTERLENWLAANASRRFKAATTAVTLAKGESPAQALEKVRAEIRDAREAIEEAANARLPSKIAADRAVAEIEALAAKGRVLFAATRFVRVDPNSGRMTQGNIRWPLRHDADDGTPHIDAVPLIAALFKDDLVKRARAECAKVEEDESDEFETLTLDERRKRIADLEATILAMEYREGAILDMIGEAAAPRHDMDVGALLQIAIDRTPPVKQASEPEPEPTAAEVERDLKRVRLRDRTVEPDFG